MSNTIKAISYEEYINTPSLRNVYNDTIVKCHLYNYGCISSWYKKEMRTMSENNDKIHDDLDNKKNIAPVSEGYGEKNNNC